MQAVQLVNVHHASDLKAPLTSGSKPVLYTHTLCPYAQRVFLALLYKAVPFELVQVDLSAKPRWYRSIHPQSLVPAVVYKGTSHTESLDICRWIDEAFNPAAPLTPKNAKCRQEMDKLLSSTPSIVSAGLDLVSGSTARSWGCGRRPSKSQQQRFEQQCRQLSTALQKQGGPFLCGPQPSLADIALLPFFERFQLALKLFQDHDLSIIEDGAVTQWMESMHSLPWCQAAMPQPKLFAKALKAHESLDFFDYATYTVFQVHPHLQH